jgi:hypothetical protein
MNDLDAKARALFERSVEQLDEASVRRLRLARRSALAGRAPVPRWRAWPAGLAGLAGLAAATVLAFGLAWWLPRTRVAAPPAPLARVTAPAAEPADDALLAEGDEDADLYAWLGEAPVAAEDAEKQL